jgi:hypothetical protein
MAASRVSTIGQRTKASWAITTAAGLGVLIFALFLANPIGFLNRYYGRVQSKDTKARYLGHGNLNNEYCWTDPGKVELTAGVYVV